MERYKAKSNRNQMSLSPLCFDDMIDEDNPVRAIDAIVESMDIPSLGFKYSKTATTGCMPVREKCYNKIRDMIQLTKMKGEIL